MLRSIRSRVIALAIGVAVVTAVATSWLATNAAERAVRTSAERSLETDTSILESLNTFGAMNGSWDGIDQLVGDLARSSGRRIAITDGTGLLLVDSDQVLGNTPRALPFAPVAQLDATMNGLPATIAISVGGQLAATPAEADVAGATGCLDNAGIDYSVEIIDGAVTVLPTGALDNTEFGRYAECTVTLNPFQGVFDTSSGAVPSEILPNDGVPVGLAAAPPALLFLGSRSEGVLLFQGPTAWRTVWLLTAVIAAAALFAWLLGRRLTSPLVRLTAAARHMESGDLTQRVTITSKDEVAAVGHAFNSMADTMQRTESLRQRMVVDIAHELRNPLVTLGGTLEAIQDGVYPTSPEVIASLAEETAHLQRLVGDLHALSVADSVGVRLARAPTDVRLLVASTVEAHQSVAVARAVSLVSVLPEDHLEAALDAGRIRQALANLLVNAIRHAAGTVTVTLSAALPATPTTTTGGPSDRSIAISVADNGPGIDTDHLDDVFERFWRGDEARARATGGTGLGLAISRELVRAHGGDITVASTPGSGAVFTITVPLIT